MADDTTERRVIQRDWVGHGLQLLAIAVVIGLPLAFWGASMNTTLATLGIKVERHERDITDERLVQTLVSGQLADVNKQLTRIDTQLEGIRGSFKKR